MSRLEELLGIYLPNIDNYAPNLLYPTPFAKVSLWPPPFKEVGTDGWMWLVFMRPSN
jgi:hypothetical protein